MRKGFTVRIDVVRREGAEALSLFAPLFFDQGLELTLHGLKSVVEDFAQRFVHFVLGLTLVGDQLVTRRHCDVDSDPERVTGMLGVVGMLNYDIATADVIAEAVETSGFAANEFVELVGFLDPAIRDFHR